MHGNFAQTACAGFGAVCGSSLATASTMGQLALKEMRNRLRTTNSNSIGDDIFIVPGAQLFNTLLSLHTNTPTDCRMGNKPGIPADADTYTDAIFYTAPLNACFGSDIRYALE